MGRYFRVNSKFAKISQIQFLRNFPPAKITCYTVFMKIDSYRKLNTLISISLIVAMITLMKRLWWNTYQYDNSP